MSGEAGKSMLPVPVAAALAAEDHERVGEWGRVLAQVANGLDDLAAGNAESIERLSMLRQLVRAMVRDLRAVEDNIETLQVEAIGGRFVDIEHVGRVERKGSRGTPNWEDDQKVAVVADAIAVSHGIEPGEAPASMMAAARKVVDVVSVSPRITKVRDEIGRDFDDYEVEFKPGRTRIVMPPLTW